MLCESNHHPSKIATTLKTRSKGEPPKTPVLAPGVLKKVIAMNLRSDPTLWNDNLFTAIVASAALEKKSSLPLAEGLKRPATSNLGGDSSPVHSKWKNHLGIEKAGKLSFFPRVNEQTRTLDWTRHKSQCLWLSS